MNDRIYPIAIKPPSRINSWGGWPADVVATLRRWNREGLTFQRSWFVFKCCDCKAFCLPHRSGVAVCNGAPLCDDCLIERARQAEGYSRRERRCDA